MADFPLEELGNKTALEVARTPTMDAVVQNGLFGQFMPIPDGFPPGSDIGNLSVFGFDPSQSFTGRAPLEAVNQGIELGPNQLAFRCNLVTLNDLEMIDFTADHISNGEAATLIDYLNNEMADETLRFHPGVGYRHLMVLTVSAEEKIAFSELACTPPHDITNQEYRSYFPKGQDAETVIELMERSQKLLSDHPVNQNRIEKGKSPATSIWLWGQGGAPKMETYQERYGVSGAVISAVDLVNGIGRSAGLEVIPVEGATGYVDTNYAGKVEAALLALETKDFVYLHIEAPDEAAHEGDSALKIKAIEDFDEQVVKPCYDYACADGNLRIVIAPDHITSIASRTHASGAVPFALFGPGVEKNGMRAYDETQAAEAGLLFERGHELIPAMIQQEKIQAPEKVQPTP
jgi:2,3-bisphosphoglycerate-independent phosphoglycerate mutase